MAGLPNKELLRVDEVAAYLSVTERTIRLWAEHGKIKAVRTPTGMLRITRDSAVNCVLGYDRGGRQ